jgi:lauroyl/myristoyl acyltransferase
VVADQTFRPFPQERIRDVRLPVRLYASPRVHRLVPTRVAMAIAAAIGTPGARHDRATERRHADHLMRDLLLHTPLAGEARRLARRNFAEISRLRELFWRPWLLERSRVVGHEHWHAAHREGLGCVGVAGHFGALAVAPVILGRYGFRVHTVTNAHFWDPAPPGFLGMLTLRMREYSQALGPGTAIPNNVSPAALAAVIESGRSLMIAFDVPGSTATPFLGRSVPLASGPATLAYRTGAKVLPMLPVREGTRIDVHIFEPLDPADYPDLRSLRAAIASVFERIVLAHPETVDFAWYPSPLVTEVPLPEAVGGADGGDPFGGG